MSNKNDFKNRKTVACAAALCAVMLLGGCAKRSSGGQLTVSGMEKLESGDYDGALADLTEAVSAGEAAVVALRGKGMALLALARYDEAAEAFNQALEAADDKMDETKNDIRLYLLLAYLRGGEYDRVIEVCSDMDKAQTDTAEVAYYLGAAWLGLGDQQQACTYFDQAVALAPTDYALYLQIYTCFESASLSAVGDVYLQQALAQTPSTDEQRVQTGRIYCYLEQYDEARAVIDEAVQENYLPALQLLGEIYLAQEDYTHARSTYQSIMETEGESPTVYNGLARCEMASGNYESALTYIEAGLALEEDDGKQQLYFNEIVVYEKLLDFTSALDKAYVYVQLYPTDEAGAREYAFLKTQG